MLQEMHTPQDPSAQVRHLLTARQVQQILHIDRSTVYRMAEDGRLPALRVGKQWRFPRDEIEALIPPGSVSPVGQVQPPSRRPGGAPADDARDVQASHPLARTASLEPAVAAAAADVAADMLGVMIVVTDMDGHPITPVTNPCPWFVDHGDEPDVLDSCIAEWRSLAEDPDFMPRFHVGPAGFECARAFIRQGRELVGMVLAGGLGPQGTPESDGLYHLDDTHRAQVLAALPRIATAIARNAPSAGARLEESA